MLGELRVVVGLGSIGTRAAHRALTQAGFVFPERPTFAHGAEYAAVEGAAPHRRITLLASYHPSRQNTNTGVLTEAMLDAVFVRARSLAYGPGPLASPSPERRPAGARRARGR